MLPTQLVTTSIPILTRAMPSAGNVVGRKSANFHPNIWGNYFLQYSIRDHEAFDICTKEVETLKEEVKKILNSAINEPLEQIKLIDALQRLGVGYHFQIEIDQALKELHNIAHSFIYNNDLDLHAIALFFRLLRQQGHKVSCDVFSKFKNDKGEFKLCIGSDAKGMLSLYEAAHFMFHGEDILKEALIFTTTNLSSIVKTTPLSFSPLGRQVQHSLKQPLTRGVPRLEAKHYISLYQEDEKWSNLVRKFAILDFNLLQSFHRKELSDISKWWKELDFASRLPFARDRLVECYFWMLGTYSETEYSLSRVFSTKVLVFVSVIDDIYDVYGTLEELQLFTDAIERWDAKNIYQLPEYMKICYLALLDIYDEMEENMTKEPSSCQQLHYAKEMLKDLARSYLVEAKWFQQGYVPKLEEYIQNSYASSAHYMLCVTSLVGLGRIITKEALEWMVNESKALKSSTLMGRFANDIVSHKLEQERGHVASAVECYMKEYNVTEEAAIDGLKEMIEEAWKDVNEECFTRSNKAPMLLLNCIMNLTRVFYVAYKNEDTYTHTNTDMKEWVALVLVDPAVR